jgi:glycosyltransferase 2 family protein
VRCAASRRAARGLLARLRRLMRAMGALSSWRTYGLTLAPTLGGWFAEGAALYLLLRHMGGEIGLLSAVFVFSFAMIVGALSMLPGGLGSTEAAMVILLGALGVDLHVALASTAIVRITTLWFAVAIGVAIMPAAVRASSRPREVAAEPRTGVA